MELIVTREEDDHEVENEVENDVIDKSPLQSAAHINTLIGT